MQAINPWRGGQVGAPPPFQYDDKPVHVFDNGITVHKNAAGSFDFVLDGMTIAQRAGFTDKHCPVDHEPYFFQNSCDTVRSHLLARGFFA